MKRTTLAALVGGVRDWGRGSFRHLGGGGTVTNLKVGFWAFGVVGWCLGLSGIGVVGWVFRALGWWVMGWDGSEGWFQALVLGWGGWCR